MKTLMAGPRGTVHPGQELDVDDAEGRALVDGGYADEVRTAAVPDETTTIEPPETTTAPPAPETATIAPPEAAVTRARRPRGRTET